MILSRVSVPSRIRKTANAFQNKKDGNKRVLKEKIACENNNSQCPEKNAENLLHKNPFHMYGHILNPKSVRPLKKSGLAYKECFRCSYCGFQSSSVRSVKAHEWSNHKQVFLCCGLCNFKTYFFADFNMHQHLAHSNIPYSKLLKTFQCKLCSFSTTVADHMAKNKQSYR